MSWIQDEVQKLKDEDERKRRAKEWTLHKSEVLLQKAPATWRAIVERVERDTRELNSAFTGDASRQTKFQEIPAWTFIVAKESRPFELVTVTMNRDGRGITIKTRGVHDALAVPVESERTIEIDLDENENVVFVDFPEGVGAVSKNILEPIIRACRG